MWYMTNGHWKAAGRPEEESPTCKVSAAMSRLVEPFATTTTTAKVHTKGNEDTAYRSLDYSNRRRDA